MASRITRKEYREDKSPGAYDRYYGQFVTAGVLAIVRACIGEPAIKASKHESFNDITLCQWDNLHEAIRMRVGTLISEANDNGGISLSDTVCTAKRAAKMIRDGDYSQMRAKD